MPLSDDQRAMLQLLLERDQGYEDIGSLLGLSVDDVRARARAALTEIGGRDPDAEVALTDYLLGQSDPIGRADVARHLAESPESRDLAAKLSRQLLLLAPSADLPDLPAERPARRGRARDGAAAAAAPETPGPKGPAAGERPPGAGAGLSARQRQILAGLIGGAVLVIAIVLIATGAFGDDDEGGGGEETAAAETTAPEGDEGPTGATGSGGRGSGATFAILEPQDGSDATGGAQFGRLRNRAFLQIDASGLEPTPQGKNYVIWLYGSDDNAFPLSFEKVGEEGALRGLAPIPAQVLAVLAQGRFDSVDVSLTDVSELQSALNVAKQDQAPPPYVGESVLRGRIQGPGISAAGGQEGG